MSQDLRARMTETFAATRDALSHALLTTVAVSVKDLPQPARPWYLPPVPPQTPREYRSALAKLGRLGIVRPN